MKYSNFAIRMRDISQFNGDIDWVKFFGPADPIKILGIRVGYGRVIDTKFKENWLNSKGKVNRIPYFYMDYYSNHIKGWGADGISDEDWGHIQAESCWNALKNDPDGSVMLDIENGNPAYAPALSSVSARAQTIAKAFLQRMDELNKKRNGIYCSIGLLNWFSSWFKDRPLWVAWYNENQTVASVKAACNAAGWIGPKVIWQIASHGDLNGDGVPDGKTVLGTKLKECDLNGWIGTNADYLAVCGTPIVTPEDETPVTPDPIDTPTEGVKYLTTANLAMRALPSNTSALLGRYYSGSQVTVINTPEPGPGGKQGWVQVVGQGHYVSLDYLKKL